MTSKIVIEFDSGEKKLFDVSPYIIGSWYGELSDMNDFKRIRRGEIISASFS